MSRSFASESQAKSFVFIAVNIKLEQRFARQSGFKILRILRYLLDNYLNFRNGFHMITILVVFTGGKYIIRTEALLEKSGKVVCVLVYVL